ncbi:MAG: hypothetical protein AAF206_11205, partial [Bacteroidota bacterium]
MMILSKKAWLFLSLFLILGAWLIIQIKKNISLNEQEQKRLQLEKEANVAAASFQRGVEHFATLVSGIRSFIQLSPDVPDEKELQAFIQLQFLDKNFQDSLIISYLSPDHVFQYSITKDKLNPNSLKGTRLDVLRSREELDQLGDLMKSDEMQLFPPLNLVEGWVGIPLNFRVIKEGKVLGYIAPIINFEGIINRVYSREYAREYVYQFSTEDGN